MPPKEAELTNDFVIDRAIAMMHIQAEVFGETELAAIVEEAIRKAFEEDKEERYKVALRLLEMLRGGHPVLKNSLIDQAVPEHLQGYDKNRGVVHNPACYARWLLTSLLVQRCKAALKKLGPLSPVRDSEETQKQIISSRISVLKKIHDALEQVVGDSWYSLDLGPRFWIKWMSPDFAKKLDSTDDPTERGELWGQAFDLENTPGDVLYSLWRSPQSTIDQIGAIVRWLDKQYGEVLEECPCKHV